MRILEITGDVPFEALEKITAKGFIVTADLPTKTTLVWQMKDGPPLEKEFPPQAIEELEKAGLKTKIRSSV